MICLNDYIIYISLPFVMIGICNTVMFLCKKRENLNSINSLELNME